MNKLLDLFTGSDNATLDMGRVIWFMGTCVFLFCELINIKTFDGQQFAMSLSTILVGGAGALLIKQSTEPK
jgi:hypothetical protein